MATVLLIEDDETLRLTVARALRKDGHTVDECSALDEATRRFGEQAPDMIITDVHLGEDSGIDFIERVRGGSFAGPIAVMTAFATVDDAVRAMKAGADDYLQKPVRLDELMLLVTRLLTRGEQSKRLRLYERLARTDQSASRPLGESDVWKQTLGMADKLAGIPVVNRAADMGASSGGSLPTMLILGETGAGKGVVARYIHDRSPDSDKPFVHVNCTAMPATLIEGELFGHVKGAFTDAKETREGLFEMADGGTIFLDEIGDLPIELQGKLLTVLEHGRIRRVGASQEQSVRVRIIAATNQDLESRVRDRQFREDLLFRLNAFTVEIPALRTRGDDAVLLARSMLSKLRSEYGRDDAQLAPDAELAIRSHNWPGNVRELFNAVQRAAMLTDGNLILSRDLGLQGSRETAVPVEGVEKLGELRFDFENGVHTADEVEKKLMIQALEHTRGNVSKASRLISMQRSSFRYRMERYDLSEFAQEVAQK